MYYAIKANGDRNKIVGNYEWKKKKKKLNPRADIFGRQYNDIGYGILFLSDSFDTSIFTLLFLMCGLHVKGFQSVALNAYRISTHERKKRRLNHYDLYLSCSFFSVYSLVVCLSTDLHTIR